MIRVTYIYSACVVIESVDCRILCDPWFTEGIYDGSWYHYPPVTNPIEQIGACDFIYVSHIHPDHYDSEFLKLYLSKYPNAQILIAPFKENFLAKKMEKDKIPYRIIHEENIGKTFFKIFPNEVTPDDIDSALAIKREGHSVVNMNDNQYNEEQLLAIREYCDNKINISLLTYTGAGPYPQTYFKDTDTLIAKAEDKKTRFFERYRRMRDTLNAKVNIPFAGKYMLGGNLADLNPYRGISDAVDIAAFDPTAVILADGGKGSIDTETLTPTSIRTKAYPIEEMQRHWEKLKNLPMLYETWIKIPIDALPLSRYLPKAYQNALRRSHCEKDYYFCIALPEGNWFVMNARKDSHQFQLTKDIEEFSPRSEIIIDPRYLFGLLTGIFHWNNAEVGSQFKTHRVPDIFVLEAQSFLNFLHL